jgi:hypothetical protein
MELDPVAVFALSAVHTSMHTDLGHFDTAGGIELTKVRRPTRDADRAWSRRRLCPRRCDIGSVPAG